MLRSPGKAGRAAQGRRDQLLCSKPALVVAPGGCTDRTSKTQPMAMQVHQLEHALPLHSTTSSCFPNLPAKPQQHLLVLGTKCTLRSWCPQSLVPLTCETRGWMLPNRLIHSSLSVLLWFYLLLLQRSFC